jgi:hypothetical protein
MLVGYIFSFKKYFVFCLILLKIIQLLWWFFSFDFFKDFLWITYVDGRKVCTFGNLVLSKKGITNGNIVFYSIHIDRSPFRICRATADSRIEKKEFAQLNLHLSKLNYGSIIIYIWKPSIFARENRRMAVQNLVNYFSMDYSLQNSCAIAAICCWIVRNTRKIGKSVWAVFAHGKTVSFSNWTKTTTNLVLYKYFLTNCLSSAQWCGLLSVFTIYISDSLLNLFVVCV